MAGAVGKTSREGQRALHKGWHEKAGHNNRGRTTVWSRGGGHKKKIREIAFRRPSTVIRGVVEGIEYDPHRSARLALVRVTEAKSEDRVGDLMYILAPKGLEVGAEVRSLHQEPSPLDLGGQGPQVRVGDSMLLRDVPIGTLVMVIGGDYARAAGTYGQLIEISSDGARIRLPSGREKWFPLMTSATIGVVGNEGHGNRVLGKAGRSRWLSRRPKVRGVAMNPVDHPHGGGEGKTSGGRPSVTPWGRPTKLGKREANGEAKESGGKSKRALWVYAREA